MAKEEKYNPNLNNEPADLAAIFDPLAEGVALPAMEAADTETLRLRGIITKQLPGISNVGSDPLVGYSTKGIDAARRAQEIGIANAFTRNDLAKMRLISRAEEEGQERFFRSRDRNFKKRLGALNRYTTQGRNQYINRFAGEVLGLGRDLYKVL